MSPTKKQLAYLQHLGVSDVPGTKAEAGEWIERVHSGLGFTDEQAAHLDRQRESWLAERVIKHPDLYPPEEFLKPGMPGWEEAVKKAIRKKKAALKAAKTEEEREELADDLECLEMDLKDGKEEIREDEKDRREDERARVRDLWEAMGKDGYFSDEIRKPTQARVKACVEELDRTKPGWSEEYPSDLCDLLLLRFPELARTAKPPPLPLKNNPIRKPEPPKKPEPTTITIPYGCLIVAAIVAFVVVVWLIGI